jgi:hypothetical protein
LRASISGKASAVTNRVKPGVKVKQGINNPGKDNSEMFSSDRYF